MRAEQDPPGIQQEQISPGDLRVEHAVNRGGLPPGDPAQNIGDRVGASEGRAPPGGHVELAKAVEQIAATDLARISTDPIVRPRQWPPRSQTAVQGHLGLADG